MPKYGGDGGSVIVRWRYTYQKTRRCRVDIAGREYQLENIIECICVKGAAPREKDGRRLILLWILMVQDIAFASIYPLPRISAIRIINVVTEQKEIYSRRQYVLPLSRSIPKEAHRLISLRVAKKNPHLRILDICSSRSLLILSPFFHFPRLDAIKSQLRLFSIVLDLATYRRGFARKNTIAIVTLK